MRPYGSRRNQTEKKQYRNPTKKGRCHKVAAPVRQNLIELFNLIQMMAGSPVAAGDLLELGDLGGAALVSVGAAGAETASARRVQGAGHIALQHDTLGLAGRNGICHRNCRDQATGVGVQGLLR